MSQRSVRGSPRTGACASGAERARLLSRAADQYEAIYRRAGGYYPGINVATLRLLAGEPHKSEQVAREVLALCGAAGGTEEDDYYRAASAAEAALVLGDLSAADKALRRAVGFGSDLAARAATRRQLRLICAARALSDEVLAPLAPPAVIHYTGHMMAPPGPPGAPESRTGAADRGSNRREARAARRRLRVWRACVRRRRPLCRGAACAGRRVARRAAVLARGFHPRLGRARAVRDGWSGSRRACKRARTITYATEDSYLGHDWIFSYGSFVAMGLAVLRSRFLDGSVRQVAVWDGEATGGSRGHGI
jgi:hypothetical protein